ncbi:hypothetical protein [Streptomyces sp. PU-14G]|uniref:hypothetical protein n=1 Tax=Streptomyces sp. PU-14G TaxID=2800808 RepID=UPI0034DF7A7E
MGAAGSAALSSWPFGVSGMRGTGTSGALGSPSAWTVSMTRQAPSVAPACGHTETLFTADILGDLGLTEHAAPSWLVGAQGAGGQPLTWRGDMRRRRRETVPQMLSPSSQAPA